MNAVTDDATFRHALPRSQESHPSRRRRTDAGIGVELAALRHAYRVAADARVAAQQRYAEARDCREPGSREAACEWSWITWACKRECKRLLRRMWHLERKAVDA